MGSPLYKKRGGGQYICVQHSHVISTMWGMFSFDVNSVADTEKTRGPLPADTHTHSSMITLTKRHIKSKTAVQAYFLYIHVSCKAIIFR